MDTMKRKNEICLLLVALLAAMSFCSPVAVAEDDTKRTVESFKAFVPKFLEAFKKTEKSPVCTEVFDVKFDVKKTDSALHPLMGLLSFHSALNQEQIARGTYYVYVINLTFDGSRWTAIESKSLTHLDGVRDGNFVDVSDQIDPVVIAAQK